MLKSFKLQKETWTECIYEQGTEGSIETFGGRTDMRIETAT